MSANLIFCDAKRMPIPSRLFFHSSSYSRESASGVDQSVIVSGLPSGCILKPSPPRL